jgi:serine/threonine-protein kinase
MPPRRAIEIIADACSALHYSHQNGIVHRDVKPANIMISKSGAVKVMDFGIARAIADAGHSLTQTAAVIGTAQYLSPEQAHGDKVDARSDVYSLGCVLYEMLTGEPPFTGDTPLSVAYQHVRKTPTRPSARRSGISPELDAVVLKSLAKNPERRYQSAAEMRNDLIRVHAGEAPLATPPAPPGDADRLDDLDDTQPAHSGGPRTSELRAVPQPDAPVPTRSRSRWLVAGAIAVVLAIVATVAITALTGRTDVPDVSGKTQTEAVQILRDRGFSTRVQRKADATRERERVIGTDPQANSSVSDGSDVTINVSSGPEERAIPDVRNLSADDARRTLADAGFEKVSQISGPSAVAQKELVTDTRPPASSMVSPSDEVIIIVGNGPAKALVPDVKGRTPEEAKNILGLAGFANVIDVQVDGFDPPNQVVGTNPAAGQEASVDLPVQVQQSRANQFKMPNVVGQTWEDVRDRLAALGWQRPDDHLDRGPFIPGPDNMKNKVAAQSPPEGTGVGFDDRITLSFGS